MRSCFKIFLLVFLLHPGSDCFATIINNVIAGPSSICYGAKGRLTGNTAGGGSGAISYLWITSTAGPDSGFVTGGGLNFSQNYFAPTFTVDTWFRRIAISGPEQDTSPAMKITVLNSPHPFSGYKTNQRVQCLFGNFYTFTDTSVITTGSISSFEWDFGDQTIASGPSVSKSFPTASNYNVKLVVTSDLGCKDSSIYTMSVMPKPEPSFAYDTLVRCFAGNHFLFFDGSTISQGGCRSEWDFGDGTSDSIATPGKTYAAPGIYNVKLISVSEYNCKDSMSRTVTVYESPRAGFTVNDSIQCLSGNQFVFVDTSRVSQSPLTSFWDFGNGDTSILSSLNMAFDSSAIYSVKLISTTERGCKDTTSKIVYVHGSVAADFTINNDSQCLLGNHFIYTDSSGTISRIWYTGGDTSSAAVADFSYPAAGIYPVALVTLTTEGCTDSIQKTVTVHPTPAPVSITGNAAVFIGFAEPYSVLQTAGSIYNWLVDSGMIVSGDSTNAISIQWGNAPGPAKVNLIESSVFGCVGDTSFLDITIHPIPDSLEIDADTLFAHSVPSVDSISILCNTGWTLSNSASWILTDQTSGEGNGVVHLGITTNPGLQDRIAVITVNAGTLSKTFVVVQSTSVGMGELNDFLSVSVFPNPSSGLVTVNINSSERSELNVFDLNGKPVEATRQLVRGLNVFDYSFLTNGVYQLQLVSGERISHIRLIIAR
jgi:PKD repeat protein